jgi:Zn-dependent peptidase ImmA (M78 family)
VNKPSRSWHDSHVLALVQSQGIANPEEAITSLCSALIDEAGSDGPPFTPEILASFRGVTAVKRIPIKEAGRLIPLNNGFEIEVNSSHTPEKQNFSIDHEICHTFFTEFGSRQIKTDLETGTFNIKREEEYLCDVGASALLFDSRWFRPLAIELGAASKSIFELSHQFKGSLEATARALCNLNLWPCAVVFWEESVKPSQKHLIYQNTLPGLEDIKDNLIKLRVRLSWHSPSFREVHYFPKHKSAPDCGLVCACHKTQKATSGYEAVDAPCQQLWMDSVYVPYRKDGSLHPRVMTVVTLSERPQPST